MCWTNQREWCFDIYRMDNAAWFNLNFHLTLLQCQFPRLLCRLQTGFLIDPMIVNSLCVDVNEDWGQLKVESRIWTALKRRKHDKLFHACIKYRYFCFKLVYSIRNVKALHIKPGWLWYSSPTSWTSYKKVSDSFSPTHCYCVWALIIVCWANEIYWNSVCAMEAALLAPNTQRRT